MQGFRGILIPLAAALVLALSLLVWSPVFAQPAPSLPTAPGAERAGEGGLSSAPASLPGGPNGTSPLEPYLVTWLLPISGIIAVIFGIYVDRRVRVTYGPKRAAVVETRSEPPSSKEPR